jgi:hypothetical protein
MIEPTKNYYITKYLMHMLFFNFKNLILNIYMHTRYYCLFISKIYIT